MSQAEGNAPPPFWRALLKSGQFVFGVGAIAIGVVLMIGGLWTYGGPAIVLGIVCAFVGLMRTRTRRAFATVPVSTPMVEAHGWGVFSLAAGLLAMGGFVLLGDKPDPTFASVFGVAAAVLFGVGWLARKTAQALVFDPTQREIDVHINGRSDRKVRVADISFVLQHPSNTVGPLIAVGGVLFLLVSLLSELPTFRTNWIMAAVGSLALISLAASLIKTRVFCNAWLIPQKGGLPKRILLSDLDTVRLTHAQLRIIGEQRRAEQQVLQGNPTGGQR